MIEVRVQGGTGAGKRKPFEGARPDWTCDCTPEREPHTAEILDLAEELGVTLKKWRRGYLARCPDCGERRPERGPART